MTKRIWDLKAGDLVNCNEYGEVLFVGFFEEGLECNILNFTGVHRINTSDLVMDEIPQEPVIASTNTELESLLLK